MRRFFPQQIHDKIFLSRLLEYYLVFLQESPLELRLKGLAYDTGIPIGVFERLMDVYKNPGSDVEVTIEDFHIIFRNIMFRYPSVRLWISGESEVFIEI